MNQRFVTSAAKQFAEKLEIQHLAPKGAVDPEGLAVSLKRYPDTKPSCSANCKAVDGNTALIAALKCRATQKTLPEIPSPADAFVGFRAFWALCAIEVDEVDHDLLRP